jgi:hypothetical protein
MSDDSDRLAEAVLLFHAGGPWSECHRARWHELTGSEAATARVLCDLARRTSPAAAYRDGSCSERACDCCGALYRGPAVYCSLTCALADA